MTIDRMDLMALIEKGADADFLAGGGIADVMPHAARARREDGEVGAAVALEPELRALEAFAELVIADSQRVFCGA